MSICKFKYLRLRYDGDGMVAIPGLIDLHVHFTGGGGEGGFSTRTPELKISDCIENGITISGMSRYGWRYARP